jgi:hypothetical protein
MSLKKFYNILFFNIFRFHCFCQYWVAKPIFALLNPSRFDGVLSRPLHEGENWHDYLIDDVLNNPKGGISLFLTGRFMGVMEAALVFTLWNLLCASLRLDFYYWKLGAYFLMLASVITILISYQPEYLNDFREFRSWSSSERRKFVLITLLVVIGICSAFVSSLAFYLSFAISLKP